MTGPFSACGVITLLTDFGLSDPFVGVMTGAILSRYRAARVVDLCHGIQAQAIGEAAFWLERCYSWFPPGSVHVAVIDPGVGSARRILAAALHGHCFVVPDNGLLSPGLIAAPGATVASVDLLRFGITAPSATFHGRDVFAPVAAALASGAVTVPECGPDAEPLPCALRPPRRTDRGFAGEIVTVDRFGNLISNLDASLLVPSTTALQLGEHVVPLHRTYSDVRSGALLALVNAFGVLEVAERDGSAARRLGLGRGAHIELIAPGTER
jgi:S-adenosylmethionine hydrolase